MKELVEKREELKAKNAILAKVFEDAGGDMDLSKVKKFGEEDASTWNTVQKAERIEALRQEQEDLGRDIAKLRAVEDAAEATKKMSETLKTPVHPTRTPEPAQEQTKGMRIPNIGAQVIQSAEFKSFVESGGAHSQAGSVTLELKDVSPSALVSAAMLKTNHPLVKTLFQTSAGWAPESIRLPGWVDAPDRKLRVADVIPFYSTSQAAVVYMLESTRTHSSAEKAEGVAFAESTFALTETTVTVRKITDSIPVTDEQLADVAQVESYLNSRLMHGCLKRLDSQMLVGDGIAPNLLGILNTGSIQTQALGGDAVPDAIHKAITKVAVTGDADANAIILHPNDWEAVRLLTSADGHYIWGSPATAGPATIWGLPVVATSAETENTGLVGDFAMFSGFYERQGVEILVGYVNDDFTLGKKTLRATMRGAMVVTRATAFCTVTGI